jgi:hypothetical protein
MFNRNDVHNFLVLFSFADALGKKHGANPQSKKRVAADPNLNRTATGIGLNVNF